jgi:uncharacterized Zn finger protein
MSDDISVDRLVSVFIKIRDARDEEERAWEQRKADFNEQLELINQQLLEICKSTDADSIRTAHGTVMRTVKSRYWTNDWEHFHKFLLEHEAPDLLEKRIHQSNMKQFLEENPELLPAGLNVDSAYSITVRRSK